MLSIIAVIGRNRELGKDNRLLWHIPGDLPRFKKITSGHPIIMGRKTFESMGKALPERTNIVVTKNPSYQKEGILIATSLDEAIEKAKIIPGTEEIFVIGGGSMYEQAITKADRLYLTIVEANAEADTFFPDYSRFNKILHEETSEGEGFRFSYVTLGV